MRLATTTILLSLCLACGLETSQSQVSNSPAGQFYSTEWNSVMVENTFRIEGPSAEHPGKNTVGTVFVLGVPYKTYLDGDKLKPNTTSVRVTPILVSAAHVFKGIASDYADLYMRTKGANGKWEEVKIPLQIRQKGKPLWSEHPIADVAALRVPEGRVSSHLAFPFILTTYLATDKWMTYYQLHPGDEVTCLGFPEGLHSKYGFPILRVGRIASYPIVPTISSRPLYIDFPVYGGNSGGPAYLIQGDRGGTIVGGGGFPPTVIGLVIQKQFGEPDTHESVSTSSKAVDDNAAGRLDDMHLAILEPASVISEIVSLLDLP